MRVHVIGGAGTGKTTVARVLADELGCRLVELDRTVAYQPPSSEPSAPFGEWERVSWHQRFAEAKVLAAEQDWVSEGIYAGWTEPLVRRADVVIWLDLPGWKAAAGVMKRQRDRVRCGDPDRYTWGSTLRLAQRAAIGYRLGRPATTTDLMARDGANSAATTSAFLAAYADHIIRCRTRASTHTAVDAVVTRVRP